VVSTVVGGGGTVAIDASVLVTGLVTTTLVAVLAPRLFVVAVVATVALPSASGDPALSVSSAVVLEVLVRGPVDVLALEVLVVEVVMVGVVVVGGSLLVELGGSMRPRGAADLLTPDRLPEAIVTTRLVRSEPTTTAISTTPTTTQKMTTAMGRRRSASWLAGTPTSRFTAVAPSAAAGVHCARPGARECRAT
jgi:hypothetical protein